MVWQMKKKGKLLSLCDEKAAKEQKSTKENKRASWKLSSPPPRPCWPLLAALSAVAMQVDLHRVAAVVLLRMLQEAPVASEMARNRGVPLMLNVLHEQVDEVETVAAGCHILYSITLAEALKGTGAGSPPVDLELELQVCHKWPLRQPQSLVPT